MNPSDQLIDENSPEGQTLYIMPASCRPKSRRSRRHSCGPRIARGLQISCEAQHETKMSLSQKPRRTLSPWQKGTSRIHHLDLQTIDEKGSAATSPKKNESNYQEAKDKTEQPARSNGSNIVRQTTIVWQDIHPKINCPETQERRKTALATALKIRKDRRRIREEEFTAKICSPKTSSSNHKSFKDIAKQTDVSETAKLYADPIWAPRRGGNGIKLASIASTALLSNRLEGDAAKQPLNGNTLFVDFTVPPKSYGKRILPSL